MREWQLLKLCNPSNYQAEWYQEVRRAIISLNSFERLPNTITKCMTFGNSFQESR